MRKIADCRLFPSESRCSLTITGSEDEVVKAAAEHSVSVHGHEDSAELREQIRSMLADDGATGRYGTVLIARLDGSFDDLMRASQEWVEHKGAAGFLSEEVLLSEDGTVVAPVFFDSKQSYERLADDPAQDRWWTEQMAPLLSDVRWIDGTWQARLSHVAPGVPA